MVFTQPLNRRNFVKTVGSGVVAAGVSLGMSPLILKGSLASTQMNNKIVIGMIGTGTRGTTLLRSMQNIPEISVGAVCDLYETHLAAGQELAGGNAKEYWDYRKLLEQKDLDAVFICVPPVYHHEVQIAAMEAEKNIFAEKPLCLTIDECLDIINRSKRYQKVFMVGQQRRYMPNYLTAINNLINEGAIGKVYQINAQWHSNRAERTRNYRRVQTGEYHGTIPFEKMMNWRSYRDMGGGAMTDLGAHQIDIAIWIGKENPPVSVTGSGIPERKTIEAQYDIHNVTYTFPEFMMNYSVMLYSSHLGVSELILAEQGSILLSTGGGQFFREKSARTEESALKYGTNVDRELQKHILVTGATIPNIEPSKDKGESIMPEGVETPEQVQKRIGIDGIHDYHHILALIDDIRNNRRSFCDPLKGGKNAIACIMGNMAMDEHREISWNSDWNI